MDIIKKFEKQQVENLTKDKNIPDFRPGDTLKVGIKIVEGKTERLQYFQGLCIARSNDSINSSFTVRKISNSEGVERKFSLYSPRIVSIEVTRKGIVRRAKLYYMRKLFGKAARIKEKKDYLNNAKNTKIAKKEVKAEATNVKDSKAKDTKDTK
jgi:large subunit ribosomal protein L19